MGGGEAKRRGGGKGGGKEGEVARKQTGKTEKGETGKQGGMGQWKGKNKRRQREGGRRDEAIYREEIEG